jgi:hypothetical protein
VGQGRIILHSWSPSSHSILRQDCERAASEPTRREFSSPPSVKRRIGIRNRLVTARAFSEQKGQPPLLPGFSLPFSSSDQSKRGTYETPTAAREPKGTLSAGSLRSPPMLKPAMTPERHPDKRWSEAGYSVNQRALPRVVPSSPPGSFLEAVIWRTAGWPPVYLPRQLGRHLQGCERDLCGLCAEEETPPCYKSILSLHESVKDEGGVIRATQRSWWGILSSACLLSWDSAQVAQRESKGLQSSSATNSQRVQALLGLGIIQQPGPGAMFRATNDKNLRWTLWQIFSVLPQVPRTPVEALER